jgi:hypothetical protein
LTLTHQRNIKKISLFFWLILRNLIWNILVVMF